MNPRAQAAPIVNRVEFAGDTWLHFPNVVPDVAIIRATTADENGNLTYEHEGAYLGGLDQAIATRNHGGLVIAQVKRVTAAGSLRPHDVHVPGHLVDLIVVDPSAFAADVTIEEIIAFLESRLVDLDEGELSRRLSVRIELLEALAGKRASGGWVASTVAEKKDFAIAYEQLASEILPDLKVRPSTDGPKATTRIFEAMHISALPNMRLRHEFGKQEAWKYTNVQFPKKANRVAVLRSSALLRGTPYQVETAGQSLSIRARTPGVNPLRPFEDEQDKVEAGLIATRDLLAWIRANAAEIARLLETN